MTKKKLLIKRVIYITFIMLLGYLTVILSGWIYSSRPQLEEYSWQGYINWADNLAYYGDYELAVKAAETAISKDPQNPEGYVFLANVHMRNRDIENAKATYEKAVSALGENILFDNGMSDILNVDIAVDSSKSEAESKVEEDSVKYATLKRFNSNGDIVYSFARSHDWERPDIETFYEYNSDNQLLKVTELNTFALPVYTTYQYYDNGNIHIENQCEYNGFVYEKTVYDENGVKVQHEVHSQDRSYYREMTDETDYVYKKEFYDTENQMEYYTECEMDENTDGFGETTVYYTPEAELMYTIHHEYSSKIKSVEKETYLNADGSVAFIIEHENDGNYYIYFDDASDYEDGNEYVKSKFYTEIYPLVYQMLGIKR